MRRLFLTLLAVSAIGFGSLSVNSALAQGAGKTAPAPKTTPAKKDTRASNVYVCKTCKVYYPAAAAKKIGYKDPMGHKLVHADKAPVGYKDGSKATTGSKMSGSKMSGTKM